MPQVNTLSISNPRTRTIRDAAPLPRYQYARVEGDGHPMRDALGEDERVFITARNSFFLASVTETGWPYVQHQGGREGFLKILDDYTIGFADSLSGPNYITLGNPAVNNRVVMVMVDYPNRLRLKVFGRARVIDPLEEPGLMEQLRDGQPGRMERGIGVTVKAIDWHCDRNITPRFTEKELDDTLQPLRLLMEEQDEEISRLRARLDIM